jgi:catalase (peroxidase I)
MSKADFLAAAANFAVIKGATRSRVESFGDDDEDDRRHSKSLDANVLDIKFYHGRKDAHSGCDPILDQRSLPNAHGDLEHVVDFFKGAFEFNMSESVAILGAHTLGRARPANSGFQDAWVKREHALDHRYYVDMIEQTWIQEKVDAVGQLAGACPDTGCHYWEFEGSDEVMMLNADICLKNVINVNQATGITKCEDNICTERSEAYGITKGFADDNVSWLKAFSGVWNKMMTKQGTPYTSTVTDVFYTPTEFGTSRRACSILLDCMPTRYCY